MKGDIRSLRDKAEAMNTKLSEKIEASTASLNAKIDAVNASLNGKIDGLKDSLASAKVWALVLYIALAGNGRRCGSR